MTQNEGRFITSATRKTIWTKCNSLSDMSDKKESQSDKTFLKTEPACRSGKNLYGETPTSFIS